MRQRRAWLAALAAGALAAPFRSLAQQAARVLRVGYIDFGSCQSTVDSGRYAALLQGLRERGYVEGGNPLLEARYADGKADRVDGFAAELVRLKVDLILTLGSAASRAAQHATTSIPIVVISSPDPVREGFAASLARPGANLARAGDVPFEQPLRYYYVINRKTADAPGIVLTDRILLQADKVVE